MLLGAPQTQWVPWLECWFQVCLAIIHTHTLRWLCQTNKIKLRLVQEQPIDVYILDIVCLLEYLFSREKEVGSARFCKREAEWMGAQLVLFFSCGFTVRDLYPWQTKKMTSWLQEIGLSFCHLLLCSEAKKIGPFFGRRRTKVWIYPPLPRISVSNLWYSWQSDRETRWDQYRCCMLLLELMSS